MRSPRCSAASIHYPPLSSVQRAASGLSGERYNRAGRRLLLRFDDGAICSVPLQWTDLVAPDPEIVMGQISALFRVADLTELAHLVARMAAGGQGDVRRISPQL